MNSFRLNFVIASWNFHSDFLLSSGNKQSRIFYSQCFPCSKSFCARGGKTRNDEHFWGFPGAFLWHFNCKLTCFLPAYTWPIDSLLCLFVLLCLARFVYVQLGVSFSRLLPHTKTRFESSLTLEKCSYVSMRYFCCLNLPRINYCRL